MPPQIGRYKIVRRIGHGGMGAVYEAVQTDLQRSVALKVLKRDLASDPASRRRFEREGVAAARIRHPNAVDITDVGEADGYVYLVMELLQGEPLSTRLVREGVLSPMPLADLLVPVASAVGAAHAAGVIHRDLKPSNLFLAQDRLGTLTPKVLDFGIARIEDDSEEAQGLTSTASVLGTPLYMAPEQVRSARNVVRQSDVYALGVVMYRALTGRVPFKRESSFETMNAIVQGECPPLAKLAPMTPPALVAVVARCMALNPAERYPDGDALAAALLPFASPEVQSFWGRRLGVAATPSAMHLAAAVTVPPVSLDGTLTTLSSSAVELSRSAPSAAPPQPLAEAPVGRKTVFAVYGAAAVVAAVLGAVVAPQMLSRQQARETRPAALARPPQPPPPAAPVAPAVTPQAEAVAPAVTPDAAPTVAPAAPAAAPVRALHRSEAPPMEVVAQRPRTAPAAQRPTPAAAATPGPRVRVLRPGSVIIR